MSENEVRALIAGLTYEEMLALRELLLLMKGGKSHE